MARNQTLLSARDTVTYQQHLKNALKLFHEPEQLGAESPLASPYFLGSALAATKTEALSSRNRGEVLQVELLHAADTLLLEPPPRHRQEMAQLLNQVRHDPDDYAYSYLVLELRAFQRFFKVQKTAEIWESEELLPGSRAEHYRDYDRAVELLGEALLDRLRPNIRLEPPAQPRYQVGYGQEFARAFSALQARQSVTICGAAGMGKSTLGANLAAESYFTAVLWYTFRRKLNDNLQSLLFALAHFLHQHGASALWRQLAVGQQNEHHLILGLLQKDLQTLRRQPLLLCFDEMEILQTSSEVEEAGYSEILGFLKMLHGNFPTLYISQTPLLESDLYCELHGLPNGQLAELLMQEGHTLAPSEIERLFQYTNGNPQLLRLALLILERGQSIEALLTSLPGAPAIQPIWQQIRQRLPQEAMRILQQLAVFRRSVPADHWKKEQRELEQLLAQGLILADGHGGVELLPALRHMIVQQVEPELRTTLHLNAASLYASLGDYTEAAYHYWQGGQPAAAVQIWYPHRSQELLRGQSGAALSIFTQVSSADLRRPEQKAVSLILAELYQRHGNPTAGIDALERAHWEARDEADAQAHNLRGQFLEALGSISEAEESYGRSIQTLTQLQQNLVHLHCQRGLLHARHRNTKQMRQHLLQARWETQRLQGMVEEFEGRFQEAHISYQSALAIAQTTGNHADLAVIQFALARVLARLGRYADALQAAQDALTHCEASADWFTMAQVYGNLAAIHRDAGQPDKALEAGRQALSQFRMMNTPYWIGITAVNLAETYSDREDWPNAERYAQEVIDQQAPHSYPYGLFTLGRVRRAQEKQEEAKELFQRSLRTAQENGDRFLEAYAQRVIGELYMEAGQMNEGRRYLEQALWLFEQVGLADEIATTDQLLAQIANAKSNGRTELATVL